MLTASWTRRAFDTRDSEAAPVTQRLARRLGAGDILLLHDGHRVRTPAGDYLVAAALEPFLAFVRERGYTSVTLGHAIDR